MTEAAPKVRAVRLGLSLLALLATFVMFSRPSTAPARALLSPVFEGNDRARTQLRIGLRKIAEGLDQATDIQFPPGFQGFAIVLQKNGVARWLNLALGTHGELFRLKVRTASEEGLLGLAFHPRFALNGRFFINYVAGVGPKDVSRVAEWRLMSNGDLKRAVATPIRVIMEVAQPYPNHNAGQLAFGPDGYLYVGWGDGGSANDPHNHGQDGTTLLGSMLRIDVDVPEQPYRVPKDNPFLGRPGFAPETWAYGLRNPWRYSFDPKGRLIVADVGQNRWEELDIVEAGDNLGWNVKEGLECFRDAGAACRRADLVDPVFSYGRDDGVSITGGFVYTGTGVPALANLYVFGDYGSGKLFALNLPKDRTRRVSQPIALGRFDIHPSTFGRDPGGELYLADFIAGDLFKLEPR